jgi:polysaccharide biosynthesis/export protein
MGNYGSAPDAGEGLPLFRRAAMHQALDGPERALDEALLMRQSCRVFLMRTLVIVLLLLSIGGFRSQAFAQETTTPAVPPKELVQYVRDARKAGQNDFQIQQNAVSSGWPQNVVTEAIAYVHSVDKDAEAPPKPTVQSPVKPENPPANQSTDTAATPPAAALGAAPGVKDSGAVKDKTPGEPGAKQTAVNRGVPDDYRIGAGDILEINVWKEPDATVHSVVVRPDGKISMPLLKEVDVVGLTPVQLEKQITDGLAKLINSPDVTIVVTGINSKKIYVTGKVKKEGPIPFTYRMTVMQALSEAGGITDYAKKKAIYVLRNDNGREFRFPFDYAAVLKGQKMELNIQLEPGDVIVVP